MCVNKNPDWVTRGRTIKELIAELQSFQNQELMVEISVDGGDTTKPISLVGKEGGICVLVNTEMDD